MSGIVGILNLDGEPVDRSLLARMTNFLKFRGPDAEVIWSDGHVGFGHTLLKTSDESVLPQQPLTLDGRVWIVADARMDARRDLIDSLNEHGQDVSLCVTDAELILRAYQVWGRACVDRLLGDFAFAIWDSSRKRLFCASDHLGIKPFFYTLLGRTIAFSNTLDCLRQHPAMSHELNDQAIGDFLIYGFNADLSSTTFASIRRIPPAHSMTVSTNGVNVQRYWDLPIEEPLHFRRAEVYVERFRDLLEKAVADRLAPGPVGVFMSGGLDSSALAAIALNLPSAGPKSSPLAFTSVFERVIPDDERFYAGLVAAHLGIPIRYRVMDQEPFGWDIQRPRVHTPEPVENPLVLYAFSQYWKEVSSFTRVFLYGEGPDNALEYEWQPYLAHLFRRRQWSHLCYSLAFHMVAHRRVPLLTTLPRMWKERRILKNSQQLFPDWFDEDFAARFDLRQRWNQIGETKRPVHPIRPEAYSSFMTGLWSVIFASMDPASTGVAVDVRHPFLDLRLLRFSLAVPALPWCRKKYILRMTLRGMIPEAVRRRAKTPLTADPTLARVREAGLPDIAPARTLSHYVNWKKLPHVFNGGHDFPPYLRVLGLNYWLLGLEG